MRCILHIGCEKTGTTSLQQFLGSNRAALLAQGILHPESLRRPGRFNHSSLAAFALDEGRNLHPQRMFGLGDLDSTERFRRDLRARFSEEIARHREHISTVVCSNEHLSSLIHSQVELAWLKAFLEPHFPKLKGGDWSLP